MQTVPQLKSQAHSPSLQLREGHSEAKVGVDTVVSAKFERGYRFLSSLQRAPRTYSADEPVALRFAAFLAA